MMPTLDRFRLYNSPYMMENRHCKHITHFPRLKECMLGDASVSHTSFPAPSLERLPRILCMYFVFEARSLGKVRPFTSFDCERESRGIRSSPASVCVAIKEYVITIVSTSRQCRGAQSDGTK